MYMRTCMAKRSWCVQLPWICQPTFAVPLCQCIINFLVEVRGHSCLFSPFLWQVPVWLLTSGNILFIIMHFLEFWHQQLPLVLALLCTFMDSLAPTIVLYPLPPLLCRSVSFFQVAPTNPVKILPSRCLQKGKKKKIFDLQFRWNGIQCFQFRKQFWMLESCILQEREQLSITSSELSRQSITRYSWRENNIIRSFNNNFKPCTHHWTKTELI